MSTGCIKHANEIKQMNNTKQSQNTRKLCIGDIYRDKYGDIKIISIDTVDDKIYVECVNRKPWLQCGCTGYKGSKKNPHVYSTSSFYNRKLVSTQAQIKHENINIFEMLRKMLTNKQQREHDEQ